MTSPDGNTAALRQFLEKASTDLRRFAAACSDEAELAQRLHGLAYEMDALERRLAGHDEDDLVFE